MRYCKTLAERGQSTCYHEFHRGRWDGKIHWRADSLLLHDDVLDAHTGFVDALIEAIPAYADWGRVGVTEVSRTQWSRMGEAIAKQDDPCQEIYREVDGWVQNVFQRHDCFTILGI